MLGKYSITDCMKSQQFFFFETDSKSPSFGEHCETFSFARFWFKKQNETVSLRRDLFVVAVACGDLRESHMQYFPALCWLMQVKNVKITEFNKMT